MLQIQLGQRARDKLNRQQPMSLRIFLAMSSARWAQKPVINIVDSSPAVLLAIPGLDITQFGRWRQKHTLGIADTA